MSPAPAQIGAYTIERELGRGGMGVVYLGHDPRLDRKVAIKALPEHFADEPERLARFEREAKTLASLNHPNVAGIYGVEEHGGARYLVLEFVEGDTLAARLAGGPLPVDEAIDIAAQIAAGVEAAHEAGVVHRDLKPGNVIVTPDGQAKVLDFGLARMDDAGAPASGSSMSPTLTSPAQHSPTIPGVILGTAAYMSPEQARGRAVDKRTDIWSFGVVLYEMLTGLRPFHGETVSDSIGAILHKPVDLDRLPPETPPRVRRVLERCLVRDRKERLRDIGDARIELRQADDAQAAEPSRAGRLGVAAALIVAIVALGVGLLGGRQLAPSEAQHLPGPLHVAVPTNGAVLADGTSAPTFDISPDGRTIAYVIAGQEAGGAPETRGVYVRDLAAAATRRVPGTEHAEFVSFSPSGRQLAIVLSPPDSSGERLVRLPVDGGPALPVVVDNSGEWSFRGCPAWLDEETLVISSNDLLRLYGVDVSSRRPELIVDLAEKVPSLIFAGGVDPVGDGRRLLFWGVIGRLGLEPDGAIFAVDVESGEVQTVLDNAGVMQLIADPGLLVFDRADTLCAVSIDPESLETRGSVVALISGEDGGEAFRVSARGDLVYSRTATGPIRRRILSVSRDGSLDPIVDQQRDFTAEMRVSPDGRRLAVVVAEPNPVAHVIDVATGFMRPVSPIQDAVLEPTWTPDGKVVYNRIRSLRDQRHFVVDLESAGEPTPLLTGPAESWWSENLAFTPDGGHAIMLRRAPETGSGDLYLVDLEGDVEPIPVVASGASEAGPALSPDGRLLAYLTDVSGVDTVAVQPFDLEDPTARQAARTVSQRRSTGIFWSPSGDELFWIEEMAGRYGAIMGAEVTMEDGLQVSTPRVILTREQAPFHIAYGSQPIHITPDGERFVFIEDVAADARPDYLNLVLNWAEEIEARLEAAAD